MALLDVLLPRRCAGCGRVGSSLCGVCLARLRPVGTVGCSRCGAPGPWPVARCVACPAARPAFATARAAVLYDAAARPVVSAWKERGRWDLAGPLGELVESLVDRPPADVISYVPADRERRARRGHAPAEGLARALGTLWALPIEASLTRAPGRPRPRQAELRRLERRANVRGAFVAAGAVGGSVCLVDDVYTTGATAASCASALRRAGATRVDVVCLARTVL
jgi:predicted amidophosphoribosyltransferase